MVISGKSVEAFEDANFATLRRFYDDGQWNPASTNHDWEVMWCGVTAFDGDTVELSKLEGEHEILEDDRGEYVQVEQEHNGLFLSGTYETRMRPYHEKGRTETKPWQEGGDADVQ